MSLVSQAALPLIIAQEDQQVVSEATTTEDWILAAVILVGSVGVALIAKRLVARAVEGAGVEERVARAVGRWVSYLVVLAGIVLFLVIVGVQIGPLFTALAALGVAVTFAIQDDLRNMWSGIQIQARRPFSLGDQISTGEWEGTVEAINMRSTTLRTSDGRQVAVPNANVMLRGIDNLTATQTRRTALRVSVAGDADLERAQRVMVDSLRGVDEVDASNDPDALIEKLGPTGVTFAVRFWHEPASSAMWRARSAAAMAIVGALREAGIETTFPQRAVWVKRGSEPAAPDSGRGGSAGD